MHRGSERPPHGQEVFGAPLGTRVAQLLVQPVLMCDVEPVANLPETDRGDAGFGSTGMQ